MDTNNLSGVGRSAGGRARAEKLTPEQRRKIAQAAAKKRWGPPDESIRRATHDGAITLDSGAIVIPCAVLSDGTRVISQRGFARGLGAGKPMSMSRRGAGELPAFLNAANLQPYISSELSSPANFIAYKQKKGGNAIGINAIVVPQICDVWLKARDAKVLRHNQAHLAVKAELIMRGLAHVGMVALQI